MADYVSPYLERAMKIVMSEGEYRSRRPKVYRSRYVGSYVSNGGTPFSMEVWNPTIAKLAAHFECEEGDIDWREDDDGNETVSVNGKLMGRVEYF